MSTDLKRSLFKENKYLEYVRIYSPEEWGSGRTPVLSVGVRSKGNNSPQGTHAYNLFFDLYPEREMSTKFNQRRRIIRDGADQAYWAFEFKLNKTTSLKQIKRIVARLLREHTRQIEKIKNRWDV